MLPRPRIIFAPLSKCLLILAWLATCLLVTPASAAPYASLVMDARNGEIILAENAESRLHPASLTKMMTLYIAFEAAEAGEISMDDIATVSENAASKPPSKLGLVAGQQISMRHLVRAAAIMSANDAATAIAEAISGTEDRFVVRMNRTARAMGMSRTTFRNPHGLTQDGHLSTAYDMTVLGRRLLFDYPDYYNLFSRLSDDAGVRDVRHTNRLFLTSYDGADGIKTGYTQAAGYNLTASARRGSKRLIATIFGGKDSRDRNDTMSELLDFGFRAAPPQVALIPLDPLPWLLSREPMIADTAHDTDTDLGVSFFDLQDRRQMTAASLDARKEIVQSVPPSALRQTNPANEQPQRSASQPMSGIAGPAPAASPEPQRRTGGFSRIDIPGPEIGFLLRDIPRIAGVRAAPRWTRTTTPPPRRFAMVHLGTFTSADAAASRLRGVIEQHPDFEGSGGAILPSDMGHEAFVMNVPRQVAEEGCAQLRATGTVCTVAQQ